MTDVRGTGRTKDQIVAAPQSAVFIWCNEQLRYAHRMLKWLDRTDIEVYGPSILTSVHGLIDRKLSAIIVDHALVLHKDQCLVLRELRERCCVKRATPLPLQAAWSESLLAFMSAYEIAAESAMGVPDEIYKIAPLAAKYLDSQGMCGSKVCRALLVKPSKVG